MLTIDRWYRPDCTLSIIEAGGFHCFGLELPWRDNREDISCIPPGHYKGRKIVAPSNGSCIEIMDVPGRTHIQVHAANYTRQIRGCAAVGDGIKYLDLDNIPDVTNSKATLVKLMSHLPDEFDIHII